jgi:hypothetical protein
VVVVPFHGATSKSRKSICPVEANTGTFDAALVGSKPPKSELVTRGRARDIHAGAKGQAVAGAAQGGASTGPLTEAGRSQRRRWLASGKARSQN